MAIAKTIILFLLLLFCSALAKDMVVRVKREQNFKWSVEVDPSWTWWGSHLNTAAASIDEWTQIQFIVLTKTNVLPREELLFRRELANGTALVYSEIQDLSFSGHSAAYQILASPDPRFSSIEAVVVRKNRGLLVRGLGLKKSDLANFLRVLRSIRIGI